MANQPIGPRELTLRYPVLAVVTDQGEVHEGLIIVEVDGAKCLPLFLSREVAELYVEQVTETGREQPLRLREHDGDEALDHLLVQLPESVGNVVWDITLNPQGVKMTSVEVLRSVLHNGSQWPPEEPS